VRDREAIAQDQTRSVQWAKDYPGKPYVSHLTPRQQSIRDMQRQEVVRAEKKAQADVNNADQNRRQDKVDAAEEAEVAKTTKELEAEDTKAQPTTAAKPATSFQAPYGRDAYGNPLPKPKP
jgi:hypothetical protein